MNIKVLGIGILLIVLWVVMSICVPESFLAGNNIENLLRRTAMYGILGIGVSFVIITSGIDLSIGSVVCLSACLLTIFLKVDYNPIGGSEVLAITPATSEIIVAGEATGLEAGDQIRYFGGRRASRALVTVSSVESIGHPADGGGSIPATRLKVVGLSGKNDRRGTVAKVYPVVEAAAEGGDRAAVTLGGEISLAPRDRIVFVREPGSPANPSASASGTSPTGNPVPEVAPTSGGGKSKLSELQVASSSPSGHQTRVELMDELGAVSNGWFAMPVKRYQRMPVPLALLLVMSFGLGLGCLHGLLVTQVKLQPFVVTLCGLLFYRGISRWSVDDQTVGLGNEYDHILSPVATGKLQLSQEFGIPYPFFILILVAVLAAVFLNRTIYGRYMLALGRNEEAARLSGIDTSRMTIVAYVICTSLAALGGLIFAIDSNSVSPSSFGNFFELYAIAAAVLGSCSLRGGEGSILGVLIGTAVMQTLYNLIVLMKISDTLEFAIIGAVILAGVIADEVIKRAVAQRRQAKSSSA